MLKWFRKYARRASKRRTIFAKDMRTYGKDDIMVRRVYVEKKKGFDVEAQGLFEDVKQNLHTDGLTGIRILNRYDIDGIDDATYQRAKYTVFAEPAIDMAYDEQMPEELSSATFFAVEYLPGQYDQRADSAAQCIKLMNAEADATVKFARVVVLQGTVTEEELKAIRDYCVNPVDSQIAENSKPDTLDMETAVPEDVKVMDGFTAKGEEELQQFRKEMGFAMSEGDIRVIQDLKPTSSGTRP